MCIPSAYCRCTTLLLQRCFFVFFEIRTAVCTHRAFHFQSRGSEYRQLLVLLQALRRMHEYLHQHGTWLPFGLYGLIQRVVAKPSL